MTDPTRVDGIPALPLRRAAARGVQESLPGVLAWWGDSTGRYWAFVPRGRGSLVEADRADVLARLVARRLHG